MRNTERIAALAAAIVAVPVLTSSPAPAAPGPDGVTVTVRSENGSGCPAGTTTVAVADDGGAFTVTFGSTAFTARAGGGSAPTDLRKNCQLALRVGAPAGYTYGIKRVDHHGSANLEKGASGQLKSTYYFSGLPMRPSYTSSVKGPYSGGWHFVENDIRLETYKPCGEELNLNLNQEIRVTLGDADPAKVSSLSVGVSDGSPTYTLAWKTCP
ncbi:DUF4360 domain-containing protein [Actinomadura graeca]|uniref:DUF4360 domain-containing protein n=1 Tax=Actinomadura graeca TaxID=2750812 RepID=A0ABX8R2K2_9ACTN|nr:DUF4360 domain-containing protein [Actinomadura graeca]QXJ23228.1 DUF4360 domain-containing protein [Actinomadura graeca]